MTSGSFNRLLLGAAICASIAFAQGPRSFGPGFGPGPGREPIGRRGAGAPVTGSPFSGTEVWTSQETLADGNVISRTSTINRYRDSQGRTRTEETFAADAATGRPARTRVSISDPVAGIHHELDSASMTDRAIPIRTTSGTTTTAGPRPNAPRRTGNTAMARTELGNQMVNGVLATGRRETQNIPVGRIGNSQPITVTRETWNSADLKMPVRVKVTDPRSGTRQMEMTNVLQTEPDPSLFTVPPGYTTVKGGDFGRGGRPARTPPAAQ
jgi:hypothetical protein